MPLIGTESIFSRKKTVRNAKQIFLRSKLNLLIIDMLDGSTDRMAGVLIIDVKNGLYEVNVTIGNNVIVQAAKGKSLTIEKIRSAVTVSTN